MKDRKLIEKFKKEDKKELKFRIFEMDKKIIIDFGKKVAWIGLLNEEVNELIKVLQKGVKPTVSSNWDNVENFRLMWNFLPNDMDILKKLSREQLINICMCGMTVITQKNSFDIAEKKIKEILNNH